LLPLDFRTKRGKRLPVYRERESIKPRRICFPSSPFGKTALSAKERRHSFSSSGRTFPPSFLAGRREDSQGRKKRQRKLCFLSFLFCQEYYVQNENTVLIVKNREEAVAGRKILSKRGERKSRVRIDPETASGSSGKQR
jgi:hypothetical protein